MPKYVLATNTGKGFYTHEDRKKFTVFKVLDNIVILDGDTADWITRVGGMEQTEINIKKEAKKKWELSVAEQKANLETEINRLTVQTFDQWWAEIMA